MKRLASLFIVILFGALAPLFAQERDAVFLHGLNSSPDVWQGAAGRLANQLAIRPHRPSLEWGAFYETQASSLDTQLGGLGSDVIAVGHSNGGIVAREWARRRPVGSIITLGSPNQGAPFVDHVFDWVAYADDVFARIANVSYIYSWFVDQEQWWWLPLQWLPLFEGAYDLWNVAENGLVSLGFGVNSQVLTEMRTRSGYMASLNSSDTLNREASAVAQRAAIVSVAKDFAVGGPFRIVQPDHYHEWHNALIVTGVALDSLAWTVRMLADFDDFGAIVLADHLSVAAEWALQLEEVWCRSVSDPSPLPIGRCYAHDGIVPAWSQAYDHPRLPLFVMNGGPIHTQETSASDDQLFAALTQVAQVPLRSSLPPPPPPPGGSVPPPPSGEPSPTPTPNPSPAPTGRYKLESGQCVWVATDSGPNQCTPPAPATGRFKLENGSCVWVATDSGPDQCTPPPPPTGRYKIGSAGCYWDANDSGPNQCTP